MTQTYTEIAATDTLRESRDKILDNDKTSISNSSGTAFPTVDLLVGQTCWRTDEEKMYLLESISPLSWASDIFGSSAPNLQILTTSGTWTKPAGLKKAFVAVVGAGGSGGSTTNDPAQGQGTGGGAAGTVIFILFDESELINSVSYTIGTGAPRLTSLDEDGTSGTATTFGTYATAAGGTGGDEVHPGATHDFAVGGIYTTTDYATISPSSLVNFVLRGQDGLWGANSSSSSSTGFSDTMAGFGGSTPFGRGGNHNTNNIDGQGFGSGGGGTKTGVNTPYAGGGAPGVVIIWEIY